MRTYGIIPARLQSSRLPRKLLLNATGRPLLQYTWEAARQAELLDQVIIATDSHEIADAAARFGAAVELTGDHPSGTDRIAEVVRRCCPDAGVVVNIQGDEPEIDPETIDSLVRTMCQTPRASMATLATAIDTEDVLNDSGCVKVVCASDGRALYFSRAAIPFCRDQSVSSRLEQFRRRRDSIDADSPWLLHIGLYAYRRDFLLSLTDMPPSRLEQLEKLEQLRALEAGAAIYVSKVRHRSVGIDTPADYARFVERTRKAA
jgi:3-deoxy-manno-octulosonate cytidylyltransferase (CMP-KDO synthetase)